MTTVLATNDSEAIRIPWCFCGRPCGSCEVVDYEPFRGISDHAPIVAELSVPK